MLMIKRINRSTESNAIDANEKCLKIMHDDVCAGNMIYIRRRAGGFLPAGCGETGSTGRKHENNRFPACLTGGGNLRKIRLNDKRN